MNDTTAALRAADADHARACRGALTGGNVQAAKVKKHAAEIRWQNSQKKKNQADIAEAERQVAMIATDLARVETEITTATSRLSALQAQQESGQRDLAALRNRIADLTPKPRRRVVITFGDETDPLIPPDALALLTVAEWQKLFTAARAQGATSAVVVFDQIHGWVLDVQHHR